MTGYYILLMTFMGVVFAMLAIGQIPLALIALCGELAALAMLIYEGERPIGATTMKRPGPGVGLGDKDKTTGRPPR